MRYTSNSPTKFNKYIHKKHGSPINMFQNTLLKQLQQEALLIVTQLKVPMELYIY